MAFMLASALLTLVSWVTPAVPTLVLYAAEALALVSLGSVYWNNVDVWVLARLKCSYEVFVILSSASASIVVNWHAAELGTYSDGSDDGGGDGDYAASAAMMNNLHATVDSCAFACLAVLFVFADSLQVRSRWFRKFCFVIFMTFVAINAVASQLLPPGGPVLGATSVTVRGAGFGPLPTTQVAIELAAPAALRCAHVLDRRRRPCVLRKMWFKYRSLLLLNSTSSTTR